MTVKDKEVISTLEESLNKMMIAISFIKANGKTFTDDWLVLPADETEVQMDFLIRHIQFIREELKEVR